jgi:3-deoxy-D-manno-octulosonate 8-phosphate phosphatase (KDO 8-P phosphatase)
MNWHEPATHIRCIILDIDGVMTPGTVGYGETDNVKFFNIRDGHAIKMGLRAGLLIGVISGRHDPANHRRVTELGMSFAYEGQKDKVVAFDELMENLDMDPKDCLYLGDDVVDIPVMRRVGLPCCVADAVEEVVPHALWQTTAPGGAGAVREVIVGVMKARGLWDAAMARYLER